MDERDPSVRNDLVCRFLRFKINESKYVQVAGAVLFASATSALSWGNIAESHWTARTLFYSCIVLALVAIVTGAQQQMVLPGDDPHLQDMDLAHIIATITGIRQSNNTAKKHNHGLIFALQAPLMLFSLAVALFLAGLFSVVFGPLGSSPLWGDNAKVAIFFGTMNAIAIIAFAGSSWWIYEIPKLRPRHIYSNTQIIYQEPVERERWRTGGSQREHEGVQ